MASVDRRTIFGLIFILFILSSVNVILRLPVHQKVTGKVVQSTGTVSLVIVSPCNINLVDEYNFISICQNLTNKSVQNALSDIDGKYWYVLEWNESSQDFLVYSVFSENKPFENLSEDKSYFVYMVEPATVNFQGAYYPSLYNISLVKEYNTPTYPYLITANVSKYLNPMGSDYDFMLKWNVTSQEFLVWSRLSENKPFNRIAKGEGQFIYVTNPVGALLRYNRSDLG